MANGKVIIIRLIVGLIKKISIYKLSHFPESHTHTKKMIKFELDLSNYGTKLELKNAAGVDTSKCTKEVDWADLKVHIDKLDFDKLESTSTNLSELSNIVEWMCC